MAEESAPNRCQQIRLALYQGPCTSGELAVLLGESKGRARVGVWILQRAGHVVSIAEVPGRGRPHKLYDLTPRGRSLPR